ESKVRGLLAVERRPNSASKSKRIQAQIQAIDFRIDALLEKVEVLSKEELNRKLDKWRQEKVQLESELALNAESPSEPKSVEERTSEAMALFDNLKEAMRTFDKLELQRLLRLFFKDVKVDFESREVIVEYSPEGLAGNETGAPSEEGPSFRTIGSGGGI
ncbi:MAG TPA: hypothetical protein VFC90_09530, partial [Planctomycetota bacterium]|nr:hypothetical protein [Planctomycetota bacterium]